MDARIGCRLPCRGSGGAALVIAPNSGWKRAGEMKIRGDDIKF